jgi:hypothetical protein
MHLESSLEMRLFNRIFGVKPGRDAPKLERLLWFRRYYVRNLPLTVMGVALVASFLSLWIVAIFALPWLAGFAVLNVQIMGERRRHGS